MKLIFQNNIEPISCKLIKLEKSRYSMYTSVDRSIFPSFIHTTIDAGTLLVSEIGDINRIRSSFCSNFILTANNGRTCFARCVYSHVTISTHNSSLRYGIKDYECKLDFRVLHKGSRSIPIPESELIGCDISMPSNNWIDWQT